jgi:uncharacterized protein (DUF58 family)
MPGRASRLPVPLTSAGWSLLIGCLVTYPVGVLSGYRVLITLALGGLAILLAAGATVLVRPRAELTRTVLPDRVTVGEPTWGRLTVRNLARWPAPGFVAVDRVGGDPVELTMPMIAGGGLRTVRYPIPTRRRGRLPLGPLTVERRDPLGLCCLAQRRAGDMTLWVHPVVHPARPLPVGTVPDFEGRRAETAHGGTMTFSALREYRPGDDLRRVHWKTTARTGVLMVREHVDTTEPTTTIVLDTRPAALTPDGFEHAVEVAASLAHATLLAGRPATVMVPGENRELLAASGAASLLDRLAAAEQHAGDDPTSLLFTVERATAGGALIVITGGREPAVVAKLGEQRRRFAPVVVVTVLMDTESHPPIRRRPGMAVLAASSSTDIIAAWDRMVLGDAG